MEQPLPPPRRGNFLLWLLLTFLVLGVSAEPVGDDYERVLIPVWPFAEGASGTGWNVDAFIQNTSHQKVLWLGGLRCAYSGCQEVQSLPPLEVDRLNSALGFLSQDAGKGKFLFVEKGRQNDIAFSSWLSEDTRPKDFGEQMPLARPYDYRVGAISFPRVEVIANARLTLRVYDVDIGENVAARVVITSPPRLEEGEIVVDEILDVTVPVVKVGGEILVGFPTSPSMAQVSLSSLAPQIYDYEQVRIDVTLTEPVRMWALLSFTDNETQRVWTVTPQ